MQGHRAPITIRLDLFEGPLDLLLYLIQTHEMDISVISISKITDQYLTYLHQMHEMNFDIAGEFLVMAATLIQWKSKSLLPHEKGVEAGAADDDVMTPEALVRQLLEHQRFRAAGQDLLQQPILGEDVFTRYNRKPPVEKIWKTMDVSSLALGYQDILRRASKRTQILRKETVSITDKMVELGAKLEMGRPMGMNYFLPPAPTHGETVVTFLAALELSRLKKLRTHQQQVYEEIFLELIESLQELDLKLAVGFENEIQGELNAATETA